MAKRKCNHKTRCYTWRYVTNADGNVRMVADALFCAVPDRGVRLGMGPSNDKPVEVQIEVYAAELASADRHELSGWPLGLGASNRAHGWLGHERSDDAIDPDASYHTGWLAREIATHDSRETRDADAWPWDVTRPIADQQDEIAETIQRMANVAAGIGDDDVGNVYTDDHAEPAIERRPRKGCKDLDPNWPDSAGNPRGPVLCVLYPRCECGDEDVTPPPADPVLQAAAARYLESDGGKMEAERRADAVAESQSDLWKRFVRETKAEIAERTVPPESDEGCGFADSLAEASLKLGGIEQKLGEAVAELTEALIVHGDGPETEPAENMAEPGTAPAPPLDDQIAESDAAAESPGQAFLEQTAGMVRRGNP